MKSLNKIFIVVFSLLSILVTSYPIYEVKALSTTDIYTMPFDKPVLDDDDVLLVTHQQSGSTKYIHAYYLPVDVFVNGATEPQNSNEYITNILYLYDSYFRHYATSMQLTALYCNPIRYANTGYYNDLELVSGTNSFDKTHNFNGTLLGYQVYGDTDSINYKGNTASASSTNDFVVLWGADAVIYELMLQQYEIGDKALLAEMISLLGQIDLNTDNVETSLSAIFERLGAIKDSNETIKTYMTYLHTLLGYIDDNVVDIEKVLNDILSNVDDVEETLSDIYTSVDTVEAKISSLHSMLSTKLDKIIEILEGKGTSKPNEPVDETTKNEHDQLEDELVSDYDENTMNNVVIRYNNNALAVVFDIFDNIVMCNQKVFTMILSIMSIGIIALILGR